MKIIAFAALVLGTSAVQKGAGFPENMNEMFPNKESMYGNDWDRYKKTR